MPNTLRCGQTLANYGCLTYNNNAYSLIMQSDGNLVLYNSEHIVHQNAIWSSKTCNKSLFVGPYCLTM